jgi:transposase
MARGGRKGQNSVIEQLGKADEAIRMYASGKTLQEIGDKFGVSAQSVSVFLKNHRRSNEKLLMRSDRAQEKVLDKDEQIFEEFKDIYTAQLRTQCARVEEQLQAAYSKNQWHRVTYYESLLEKLHADLSKFLELRNRFKEGVLIKHEVSGNLGIINDIIGCEPSYNAP